MHLVLKVFWIATELGLRKKLVLGLREVKRLNLHAFLQTSISFSCQSLVLIFFSNYVSATLSVRSCFKGFETNFREISTKSSLNWKLECLCHDKLHDWDNLQWFLSPKYLIQNNNSMNESRKTKRIAFRVTIFCLSNSAALKKTTSLANFPLQWKQDLACKCCINMSSVCTQQKSIPPGDMSLVNDKSSILAFVQKWEFFALSRA